MPAQKDDLEAVRAVAAALEGFDAGDQERIIRWAREKLGLSVLPAAPSRDIGDVGLTPPHVAATPVSLESPPTEPAAPNLKTFCAEKKPRSDVQFAATVAYFHRFEAPEGERKNEITGDDLVKGSRFVNRPRLRNAGQTLLNANKLGLLDRVGRGAFTINSVGENLVAMTLPGDGTEGAPASRGRLKRSARKKPAAKAAKK